MLHAMFCAVKEQKYGDELVIIQNRDTEAVTAVTWGNQKSLQYAKGNYVQVKIKVIKLTRQI